MEWRKVRISKTQTSPSRMLVEAWILKALQVSIQKKPGKVLGEMYLIEDMNPRRQDVARHANIQSAIVSSRK